MTYNIFFIQINIFLVKIPSPKNAIAKNLHNSLEELNFDDLVLCPGDSNSLYLSERSAQYCDIFSRNSNSSCSPMFFVKDEASVDSDSSTTPDEENVSKFVTRAPPMGCEKLKPNKPEACGHSSSFQPFASTNFQLKQSSSSAFSQPLLIRPKPKSALAIATSHAPLAADKEQPDNDDENDANKDDKQEDSSIANIASTSNK